MKIIKFSLSKHRIPTASFSQHYPRGEKALIGPLHRWGAEDTVRWFEERGVPLKTEADGRMFPVTNDSQTIIDCLSDSAHRAGVEVRRGTEVTDLTAVESGFRLETASGDSLRARQVLLATGGTRQAGGAILVEPLGHSLAPAVPSLFTFKIADARIAGLHGLSVPLADCAIEGSKLKASGPLLITHWGMSGPGILRLSAWGARELAARNYRFHLVVNWLAGEEVAEKLKDVRQSWGKRQIGSRCPFENLPKRLWERLTTASGIASDQVWSRLTKTQMKSLVGQLVAGRFAVDGKSLNKDEFVTCGGVLVKEIDLKTMESRLCPGLFFAGEVIDVDGVTGGFNFQNAWTTGYHAGIAIAARRA